MLLKIHVFIFGFLITSAFSGAQSFDTRQVNFYTHEETKGRVTLEEISQTPFTLLKSNALTHEVTKSSIWIRFQPPSTREKEVFLELTCPNFAEVVYYQPGDHDDYKEFKAGMLINFNDRPIPMDRFAFQITPGDKWHYLKIRTDYFINTEFHIKTLEEIIDGASARNLLYMIYLGLMISVVAGVLFYIYLIRFYSYLFYVGYIFFLSSVSLMERGFYFQQFWPNNPEINSFFPILPFGISICMLLFLRGIWINHRIVTILYRLSVWGLTVLPLFIVLFFSSNNQFAEAVSITQTHSFLIVILIIVMSSISLASTEKAHKLPLILINAGFCILCVSGLIFLSTLNHLLPSNFFTDNSMIFGSILEVGCLTAALAIRSDEIYKKQKLLLLQRQKF